MYSKKVDFLALFLKEQLAESRISVRYTIYTKPKKYICVNET